MEEIKNNEILEKISEASKNEEYQAIETVDSLVKSGELTEEYGLEFLKSIKEKYEIPTQKVQNEVLKESKFDFETEFLNHNPEYKTAPHKVEIMNFLKQQGAIEPSTLFTVSKFVQNIENEAIKQYKQKMDAELNLKNQEALKRMNSLAQNANDNQTGEKIWSIEEIQNMSNKDFLRYEKAIKKQLIEGKIYSNK